MHIGVTIEDVLSDENILVAISYLKTKKNACGDDGIWLYDLEQYWKLNGENIKKQVKDGTYHQQMVHEKIIVSSSGKHRKIYLFSSVDRMIQRAIVQVLQEPMEQCFSLYSFAYQTGKGIDDAVVCAAKYIESGKEYVVQIDIKDFFENISHEKLLRN